MDGAAVRAALDQELARFGDYAIDASMLLIALDESAEPTMASALSGREWDVVVIGGGIRKPEPLLPLFEQAVNLVRRHAPRAAIAFNTSESALYLFSPNVRARKSRVAANERMSACSW